MATGVARKRQPIAPNPFRVLNAPGGSYNYYSGGQRRFVPAGPPKVRDLMVGGNPGGDSAVSTYGPLARAPKPAPKPAAASPYAPDAEYFTTVAQQRFKRNQQLNQLTEQGAYDRTDFQEGLRRLHEQQPKDLQTVRENAARQGLFYSGQLGKQEGDVNTDYARRQSDSQLSFDRREAARAAARRALLAGASIEQAAALAASIDRRLDRDAQSAAAGTLARNPGPKRRRRKLPAPFNRYGPA
jgi:hypothetical protein